MCIERLFAGLSCILTEWLFTALQDGPANNASLFFKAELFSGLYFVVVLRAEPLVNLKSKNSWWMVGYICWKRFLAVTACFLPRSGNIITGRVCLLVGQLFYDCSEDVPAPSFCRLKSRHARPCNDLLMLRRVRNYLRCYCYYYHYKSQFSSFVNTGPPDGSDFSKRSPTFMKFDMNVQHLYQMSLLTFERSRSKFKVKTAVLKVFRP